MANLFDKIVRFIFARTFNKISTEAVRPVQLSLEAQALETARIAVREKALHEAERRTRNVQMPLPGEF